MKKPMNTMTKATENRPATDGQHSQQNQQRAYVSPRVNITENKDGYLLEAEMPGVNKEGLEISLEGNELTIVGRRGNEPTELQPVYRESSNRDFRRVFVLDPTIDTSRIEARMENGVLKLHLPKAEQVKPRKITVTG
jgi:HSP20 family protein